MYTPNYFRVDDAATLTNFIRQHSFATLVTHDGQQSHATHLPMHLQGDAMIGGRLTFHMARANPQWRHCTGGTQPLVIFSGPHAYISPAWYAPGPNVPTWNYTAVHVYGRARIIDSPDEMAGMLQQLVENYETDRDDRWRDDNADDYRDQLIKAIVGIELTITNVEGKFKLSQNRPSEDAQRVIDALAESSRDNDRELAEMMKKCPRA